MPTTHESTHRQVAASACIAEPSTPLLASRRPRTSTSRALCREAPSGAQATDMRGRAAPKNGPLALQLLFVRSAQTNNRDVYIIHWN